MPRTSSPSLTAPRGSTSIASGATARVYGSTSGSGYCGYPRYGYYPSACYGWNSWWDPCHYDPYPNYGWSIYGGCGSFGWSFSLWNPWYWARSCYWNSCYASSWWYGSYYANCLPTSYWWYPSTTYCPTYLYVPGSVAVVQETSSLSGDAAGEVVVAGGRVAGVARASEFRGDVGARASEPVDMARKYVELGDFYFKAGRFAEAVDAYARARTYAPNDASVHFVMADGVFATGDYHFAAFLIGEALRLDPPMATADTDKRLYYGDPSLFEQQMAALERYLEAKPYDAQAHLVRGYNLRFSGRPAAAVSAFRRVLEISPENRAAQIFLSALEPKDLPKDPPKDVPKDPAEPPIR